jgi:hypothetical protein
MSLVYLGLVIPTIEEAEGRLVELRKVALSHESPIGLPIGGTFPAIVGAPAIDNQGNVSFIAALTTQSGGSGVWVESNGGLRLVASSGSVAPSTRAVFSTFSDLVIAGGGVTAFKAKLSGAVIDDHNQDSIWLDRAGNLTLVTQAGKPAPSPTGDLRFSHFETPIAVNGNGELAFFARTLEKESGNTQSSGIWTANPNEATLAANDGLPAIAGQPGIVFLPQSFEQPFANDVVVSLSGQTIFRGFLTGPGITETNLNGLWSYRPSGGLELLMRAGDAAAGIVGARFLSFPGVPTINASGDTAFIAFVERDHEHGQEVLGGAIADADAQEIKLGLWLRHASGKVSQIFAIGDQAPGIEGNVHFVDAFNPVMNAASRIAFVAAVDGEGVDGSNEVGLWSDAMTPDGRLRLIARQGDQAPGREPGFVFGVFLEPSLNAAGQTAFVASGFHSVDGSIVDSAFGIWGQDRAGQLRLVVSVGDLLEVSPGDHREIASLMFTSATGGDDGRARGLNDAGQIALRATFTDGSSGVFVSDALTVPEPSTAMLLCSGAACFWPRRRAFRSSTP